MNACCPRSRRTPTRHEGDDLYNERAKTARKMVLNQFVDQPEKAGPMIRSALWHWIDDTGLGGCRRVNETPVQDTSHSCHVRKPGRIHCNLCVRACREVQVNDVIGMASGAQKAKSSSI